MNSAKKKRIRVNVHLYFRQLDCSVMLTSRSHPWSCIPFDRWDTTKITSVTKDQPWRSNEHCFELLEVYVLGSTQILLVIGSEGTGDVSKQSQCSSKDRRNVCTGGIEGTHPKTEEAILQFHPFRKSQTTRTFKKKRRKSLAESLARRGRMRAVRKCFCTPSFPKCDVLLGGLVEGVSKVPSTLRRSAMTPMSVFHLIR